MLTLEMAIQKIHQLPPEQRNQIIQFIEFLDFKSSQTETTGQQTNEPDPAQAFFELAGLWENKKSLLNPYAQKHGGKKSNALSF
jgi:hypothetical protein